jgi:hypothetical protein
MGARLTHGPIGILLLDFPGKRALDIRILRRRAVIGAVNRLRREAGRPPLRLPDT